MTKKGSRRRHETSFKATVASAAVKGDRTVAQHSARSGVHSSRIHVWKKRLPDGAEEILTPAPSHSGMPTKAGRHLTGGPAG